MNYAPILMHTNAIIIDGKTTNRLNFVLRLQTLKNGLQVSAQNVYFGATPIRRKRRLDRYGAKLTQRSRPPRFMPTPQPMDAASRALPIGSLLYEGGIAAENGSFSRNEDSLDVLTWSFSDAAKYSK